MPHLLVIYAPDDNRTARRYLSLFRRMGMRVVYRNPFRWAGEVEKCTGVLVEDGSGAIAEAYGSHKTENGVRIRVLQLPKPKLSGGAAILEPVHIGKALETLSVETEKVDPKLTISKEGKKRSASAKAKRAKLKM